MLKRLQLLLVLLLFTPLISFSQFPDLEFNISTLTVGPGGTVNVPVTAGSNWSNITQFSGTFTYDPTVLTWNTMENWGLSNLGGASFTVTTPGTIQFSWTSLISIGPSLGLGATIFDLKFNVIGAIGTTSPITFGASPQAAAWQNGFGWGGTNFLQGNGSVTIACLSPIASWTSAPNFYTINFTNTATNTGTTLWDFGDGNTSTMASPSHTYATPGNYTVCMTETNACGSDSTCTVIGVCTAIPVANFNLVPNQLDVSFVDGTSSAPTTWLWDFGDGNTSTMASPTHTYTTAGTYTVCLTSGNGCGSDSTCQTVTVSCATTTANYTSSTTNLTTTFTDGSTGPVTSYLWDFGDGTTSTLQNPVHTYATQGSYTVCLTTTNSCSSDNSCQTINIVCPTPSANWSNANAGLSSIFTDMTTGNPISWLWNFGDGTTSSMQNPIHAFPTAGTYTVCLYAGNPCGQDTLCQTVTIVCPVSTAAFSNSVTGLSASFTDNSSNNPTSWAWDFGDGNTSTMQNPTHTYATDGTYNACLIVSNACGSDTICNSVTVVCPNVSASWSNTMANEVVTFTDNSTNTPTVWAWDFGDGNTSTLQNPVHTYTTAGTYTVCLIATSACGSDTSCTNITVSVTGIDELDIVELNISPNPAKDLVQINSTFAGVMRIEMYDLQGKLISKFSAKNEDKIDVSPCTKGTYILVIDMDGTKVSRKLLID